VVVAMSGGVDSSVAATLLKRDGFDVIGVFMKFWQSRIDTNKTDSHRFENRCCSSEAEKRARVVAVKLKIPFYVFNFEKEFKAKVVDYFLKEERAGLTPNPCVVCNKEIKFGLLLEKALSLNADYIATGHYARIKNDKLIKGKDGKKDQSYFLWKLNKKILKNILFPVGEYNKIEVKGVAKRFKLPVVDVPESQEICFVENTLIEFLTKYLKPKSGDMVCGGGVVGKHIGLPLYTIGQRKGIGLAGGPYYVLKKDIKKNILVITKDEKDLYRKELSVKNLNWISNISFPMKVRAKIRYRTKEAVAVVDKNKVFFSKPQRAITSGQSIVFYKGQELLGGGIIV